MELKGNVFNVIFRNADNGYSVVELSSQGRLITAVGKFPPVTEGQDLILSGSYVMNPQFGQQFNASSIRIAPPTSIDSIVRYLSGGLFKGVGEVTAYSIVEMFGENTLKIIENSPAELAKVKGISLKKAMEINNSYNALSDMQ
ncbi:MAG: ATP-dependent RecD-like DNA helicase, partial [Clostridia bacterium]|nr:ATP-dependent RecD-like DNA helicase [Clostridia bacterium]